MNFRFIHKLSQPVDSRKIAIYIQRILIYITMISVC